MHYHIEGRAPNTLEIPIKFSIGSAVKSFGYGSKHDPGPATRAGTPAVHAAIPASGTPVFTPSPTVYAAPPPAARPVAPATTTATPATTAAIDPATGLPVLQSGANVMSPGSGGYGLPYYDDSSSQGYDYYPQYTSPAPQLPAPPAQSGGWYYDPSSGWTQGGAPSPAGLPPAAPGHSYFQDAQGQWWEEWYQ